MGSIIGGKKFESEHVEVSQMFGIAWILVFIVEFKHIHGSSLFTNATKYVEEGLVLL